MSIGVSLEVDDRAALDALGELLARARNPRSALVAAGLIGLRSVQRNFDVGGRPTRWKQKTSGERSHLQRSGRLQRSVRYQVLANGIKWGTRQRHAALHHFGGTIRPKRAKYLSIPIGDDRRLAVGAGAFFRRYPDRVFSVFKDGARGTVFIKDSPDSEDAKPIFVLRRKVTLPARPFLLLQDEDHARIVDMFESHLAGGL
jgi:phage gpG-like protein